MNVHTMLFLKCILSPVRCSVPYSIFSKYSLFSTSNLSNVTEEKEDYRQRQQNAMAEFLLNECGLSESQVSGLCSRRAKMFETKSTHRAQQAVQFFRDSGFTENQVRKILFMHPPVLNLEVDTQLKPKIEFMKELGFTGSNLRHFLSLRPRLVSIKLEQTLSPKIPALISLFGSKLNLCKALMSYPEILECKVENLKPKIDILKLSGIQDELFLDVMKLRPKLIFSNSEEVLKLKIEYVRNWGVLKGSKAFVAALFAVDSSGLDNFENKIKHMAKLGLLENEIIHIVKRAPRTFANSIDKTEKNMDFLKHTAGFKPNIVVSYPCLLYYSIENRMRPRHKVIEFLRETEPSRLSTDLAPMYILSEQNFALKFLMGNPEATKLFEKYKVKSDDIVN
ncbi:transcription termination factor MTERF6, chloroplastic/mitochondrial [Cryptomeria japonica]|uniref:transcription termination factor MTERF6, chloroplastic/mitochondrial n=1 Tax=Cryptomeria japonica TaxID=3369 RepID=UPI0027D9D111|nr:transcription termination factor MTERF6, chloroplastic/mitochondrial [Cryptomeria japonica]